jgi:3-dehydroquinate synthetase
VEAYKTGLVASSQIVDFVERDSSDLMRGDLPALAELLVLASRAKTEVVSKDFREAGLRQILNFGHTFGHAIEAWNAYRVTHGQAVAAGMIVAARLSRMRGLIAVELEEQIAATTRKMTSLRIKVPTLDEAWNIMKNDKKVRGGRVVFVLLEGIARPICVEDVSREEVGVAMAALEGI